MLLIGLLKSQWAKGHIGELLVRLLANWQLDKHIYSRLHNATLSTQDGTTQIDHVLISPFGIFVLETKIMSGCRSATEQGQTLLSFGADALVKITLVGTKRCSVAACSSAK